MKNGEKELRFFDIHEIRAIDETNRSVSGYAAVFDTEIRFEGWFGAFREKISRGAFDSSIKKGDVLAVWNHNTDLVLGSQRNNSLTLLEDDKGLRFVLNIANTTTGRDAYENIRNGNVRGMSFGFSVKKQSWEEEKDKEPLRNIQEVTLYEVSPTGFPAYVDTSVSARSGEEVYKEFLEFQKQNKPTATENVQILIHRAKLLERELKNSYFRAMQPLK